MDYHLKEDEYLGADGLVYCRHCRTPRTCYIVEVDKRFTIQCECQKQAEQQERERQLLIERKARVEAMRKNSALGKNFFGCTFDCSDITAHNADLYALCKAYCTHAEEMLTNGYGVYLYGATGVGKTHLTACMGNALTDGLYSVFYTSFLEIDSELKSEFGNNTAQQKLIEKTECVDFLFLDDLGTENLKAGSTTWMQSIVFDIINRRYNANKPIVCSSNYTLAQLMSECNYEQRAVHRLMEMCPLYRQLDCEIMRDSIAEQKRNDLMKILGENRNE